MKYLKPYNHLNESNSDLPPMPKVPPMLSTEDQRKLFKVNDYVIVRPDAFDYYDDIDEYEMTTFLGQKAKIIKIETVYDRYGSFNGDDIDDYIGEIYDLNDLIITTILDEYSDNKFYWYYRCLFPLRRLTPDYTPRKIDREI